MQDADNLTLDDFQFYVQKAIDMADKCKVTVKSNPMMEQGTILTIDYEKAREQGILTCGQRGTLVMYNPEDEKMKEVLQNYGLLAR